ncbi:hypothetical protein HDU92_000058 [Lobulomyces angularis]|nr:hypothetical protein HDU92_000058 [Lobulomyces angularis]
MGNNLCTNITESEDKSKSSLTAQPSQPPIVVDSVGIQLNENKDHKHYDVDPSFLPGDDFYRYVNQNWLKDNKIPADKSSWGPMEVLNEESRTKLQETVNSALKNVSSHSENCSFVERLVGLYYESGMNMELTEQKNLEPIQEFLTQIDEIGSIEDVLKTISSHHKSKISSAFFSFGQLPDPRRSDWTCAFFEHSGLVMPDREFYLDESKKDVKAKYEVYAVNLFKLAGIDEDVAKANFKKVFDIEMKLAEASYTRVERREIEKLVNKYTVAQLLEDTGLPFEIYIKGIGLEQDFGVFYVDNPKFFKILGEILKTTPLEDIKCYLTLHFLSSVASFLTEKFQLESFTFHGKVLQGRSEREPRWKKVLDHLGEDIRDPLGELYIKNHFSAESKQDVLKMVKFIINVLHEKLAHVTWLENATKEKALMKLKNLGVKIGYPDKWVSYEEVADKLDKNKTFFENRIILSEFNFKLEIEKINKAVDPLEWEMPPYMVNAYFHPMRNEIVFPAAFLTDPFYFPPTSDKSQNLKNLAQNFGAIGMVMAHEITHGFDDMGRKFDHKGELNNWWTTKDAEDFEKRTKTLEEQFNKYEFFGEKLNGKLCLGENCADLGGVVLAYEAMKEWLKVEHPESMDNLEKDSEGFSLDQRFFVSFARIWRNLVTKEKALNIIKLDPHSPGEFRVNGVLTNFEPFYKAFNVKEGEKLYRKENERVQIW